MNDVKASLLRPLRTLADAYAEAHELPRVGRMSLRRRGGRIRLRVGDIEIEGHVAAPTHLVGALVASCAGLTLLGRPVVWQCDPGLHWQAPEAFLGLSQACLKRKRKRDARDLAYLAIVETGYEDDVADGTRPAAPAHLTALVRTCRDVADDLDGAHLTVLRTVVKRLQGCRRAEVLPLLRAMDNVISDASYANELTLAEIATAPALEQAQRTGARREVALEVISALASQLTLGKAYAEAEPLLTALIDAGVGTPHFLLERFVARAAMGLTGADDDCDALESLAATHRTRLRPQVAELEPWAALALAHIRIGEALWTRANGGDPSERRPKKAIAPITPEDAEQMTGKARKHVEHARRLLGDSLVSDVSGATFEAKQRRQHIHESFHALDGALHKRAKDYGAALTAFKLAHESAQRDAYDHKKNAHAAEVRALAKRLGVES